jgi:uncharacterized membrane protein YkgB
LGGCVQDDNTWGEWDHPSCYKRPLISWNFKLFGTYLGSDIIGATEWIAALLILAGRAFPKAGIAGGAIGVIMFTTTSTMLITTPNTTTHVHDFVYLNDLGLFLYKDIISLGACLFLISYFGKKIMD